MGRGEGAAASANPLTTLHYVLVQSFHDVHEVGQEFERQNGRAQRVREFSTVARQKPAQPEVGKPERGNPDSSRESGLFPRAGRRSGGVQSLPSPSRHVRESGNDPEGQSREVGLSVPREFVPRQKQEVRSPGQRSWYGVEQHYHEPHGICSGVQLGIQIVR